MHLYASVCIYVCVCMYKCVCVCVYVYLYVWAYVYINKLGFDKYTGKKDFWTVVNWIKQKVHHTLEDHTHSYTLRCT